MFKMFDFRGHSKRVETNLSLKVVKRYKISISNLHNLLVKFKKIMKSKMIKNKKKLLKIHMKLVKFLLKSLSQVAVLVVQKVQDF
jgi:hypothetical protein